MNDAAKTADGGEAHELDLHFLIDVGGKLYLAQALASYDPDAAANDEQKEGVAQARRLFENGSTFLKATKVNRVISDPCQRTDGSGCE